MERFVDNKINFKSHEEEQREYERKLKKLQLEKQKDLLRRFQHAGILTPDVEILDKMSELLARFSLEGLSDEELTYLGALSDKYNLNLGIVGYRQSNYKIDKDGNKNFILGGYTEKRHYGK